MAQVNPNYDMLEAQGILTGIEVIPSRKSGVDYQTDVNKIKDYVLGLPSRTLSSGAGFAGAGTIYKTSISKEGDIFKTTILLDITGAKSSTTDLDIIGNSGVSHIGQITAALNGTLFFGQITCLVAPATGVTDIDFYSATEGTGAFDDGIAALTETVMRTTGGAWAAAAATQIAFTNLPAANSYMYLTCGAAGTVGTYTAGKFLIEFWGV